MAHLGNGKKITTLNDEKIVFTDSKGENMTMEVSDFGNIIKKGVMQKTHSDILIDCNEVKTNIIISGFKWGNAPSSGIAILEVIDYSPDWILQRYTPISSNPITWTRCFYAGTTWTAWEYPQGGY